MQAKFAPIVPPKLLPTLKSEGHLGDYNLLLVQEVLEHQEIYREVFKDYESFNILDNGVVETGESYSAEEMYTAAVTCNARVIILPDIIEDTNATLNIIRTTRPFFESVFTNVRIKYMCVPQGRDLQEVIFCAMKMNELIKVGMWGIPRSIVKNWGTRSDIIFHLNREFPQIPIHLLGFSNNLIDDISCARHMPVGGIDSSLPTLMGGMMREIQLGPSIEGRRYRLHDEKGKKEWNNMEWSEMMNINISNVRSWLGE